MAGGVHQHTMRPNDQCVREINHELHILLYTISLRKGVKLLSLLYNVAAIKDFFLLNPRIYYNRFTVSIAHTIHKAEGVINCPFFSLQHQPNHQRKSLKADYEADLFVAKNFQTLLRDEEVFSFFFFWFPCSQNGGGGEKNVAAVPRVLLVSLENTQRSFLLKKPSTIVLAKETIN